MPRVPHSVKRIKLMTLAREEQLEASLERNEWIPSESDDDEVKSQKTILEEEVDDEEGDVFLDADCVEETASQASFISKFSFTSTSAPSTPSSSPSPSPPRSCVYTGNSTRTQERRRSSSRSLEKESKSIQSIHSYFSKVSPPTDNNDCVENNVVSIFTEVDDDSEENLLPPDAALVLIDQMDILSNSAKDLSSIVNAQFEVKRAMAVRTFLLKWIEEKDKFKHIATSRAIAQVVYSSTTNTDYRAKMIRYWAKHFRKFGEFPLRTHGKYSKVISFILDEDVSMQCAAYIRSLGRKERQQLTAKSFRNWINSNIPGIQISESTGQRWLHHLGFNYKNVSNGIYVDGHEREDVVAYRKYFVSLMMGFKERMTQYDEEKVTPPQLERDRKELVLVVHDECTFAAHDGKKFVWMQDGQPPLRPKGDGNCIMISQFLCPCHGVMTVTPERAAQLNWDFTSTGEIIIPGKNRDGYWVKEDLIRQFTEKAIPLFNELHPGKTAVFAFDNSQSHSAMADDALNANKLNLHDGNKSTAKAFMRDGYFYNANNEKIIQRMVKSNGEHKGIKSILMERGLWRPSLKFDSARQLLSEQEDFKEQRKLAWVKEVGIQANHIVVFLPKFHPEFNFIERYWGIAKRYARERCDYSFPALNTIVPEALGSVSLATIRRLHNHCWRYMEAYLKGTLVPHQVEWAMKKYTSHRRVRENDEEKNFPPFLTPEFMVGCPS